MKEGNHGAGAAVLRLLPAVDISAGLAVRPVRGQLTDTEGADPVQAARAWAKAGADWIHLVDLDLAFGRGNNTAILQRMVQALHDENECELKIQVSGGIKDSDSLRRALSLNPDRINITSAALARPEWLERVLGEYGNLLALGVDVRDGTVVARGSDYTGGTLESAITWLNNAGVQRYIVTDVSRDGALNGPGLEVLERVLSLTDRPVVASGGVSSLEDIRTLRAMVGRGLEGLVLGKALYAGRFTLRQALAAAGYPTA